MRTFWTAFERARAAGGVLVLRNEDLDPQRSRAPFAEAMLEDLRWFGISWQEGPDIGGPFAPYQQSRRRDFYLAAWRRLRDLGAIYPCTCSRRDLAEAAQAPHEAQPDPNDEPVYPGTCRGRRSDADHPAGMNWRFRVPDGELIAFHDLHFGRRQFRAGSDFGDFLLWRRDDVPAYQLAVVVDDDAMRITEVVRGADLLKSTARQLLLFRVLGLAAPAYYHCDLVTDTAGVRLAKRHDALSIRALRAAGNTPEGIRAGWARVGQGSNQAAK
jgi:glutamyl-tRNA synthetase